MHKSDGNFDVIVAGNGVLGLSLGLTLARQDTRVAVLGTARRPWSASSAAGAMLGTFGEVTAPSLKSDYGRTKLNWAYKAAQLWPAWLAELDAGPDGKELVSADGTVVILNTVGSPDVDSDNYAAIRTALEMYHEPFEDVDPSDVAWLDPDPHARPLKAMFLPREHAVDAARLLPRLEAAFARAGGTQFPEFAKGIRCAAGRVDGVWTESDAVLSADHVVLAAGVGSQSLLDSMPDLAACIPRLVSGYGVSALVSTHDGCAPHSVIRTPNRAFACGLHVVPRGLAEVYVGATNLISPEPVAVPQVEDTLFLLRCVTRQLRRECSKSELRRIQVGNRPVALDGMPLIGSAGLEGLWMLTGTYRDGLHLSPLLARQMAACIRGEEPIIDMDMFKPVRAPIQPLAREEVVAGAVTHMLAAGYESDWDIPTQWPYIIEYSLHAAYMRMANELDPAFTPPPEILAATRVYPSIRAALLEYYGSYR
jgi:glycine oxidase